MRGAVCLLTLNRPDKLNALNIDVANDFSAAVQEAVRNRSRAIVLTGAGRAFCAGGDLREMQTIASREGRLEAFFDEPLRILNEAILLIRKTPIPFIAAVNGVASGGGCNLALACDLVIAAESAKFNQAFIKIGLNPDCGGTFILPRLVGWKRAAELMFTGDMLTAQQALEMGMIDRVVPPDALLHEARSWATELSQGSPTALGLAKSIINQTFELSAEEVFALGAQAQAICYTSAEHRASVEAFLNRTADRGPRPEKPA